MRHRQHVALTSSAGNRSRAGPAPCYRRAVGVSVHDSASPSRYMECNWWSWRPTVEILKASGIQPEYGWERLSDGLGAVDADQTTMIIRFLEGAVLGGVETDARIKLDGSIASVPDDGVFHRPPDHAENYSASAVWLAQFVEFLRSCTDGWYVSPA